MKKLNTKIIFVTSIIVIFVILMNFTCLSQNDIKIEVQSIDAIDEEKDWPYNFTVGWSLQDPEDILWYAYDPPNTPQPEICPGISQFTCTEDHSGQYKERLTYVRWKLYRNESFILEYSEEFQMGYAGTWENFSKDFNVAVNSDATYYFNLYIKQHRLIIGWKELCDKNTNSMLVKVHPAYRTVNTTLSGNASYDRFALTELTLAPGFWYDPNTGYEFEGYIKTCPVQDASIVENLEISDLEDDFKSSEIISNEDDFLKNYEDEIIVYPNPSNDGKFTVKSMKSEILQTNVFNSGGNLVYSKSGINSLNHLIDLSHGKGMHFIQIISNDKVVTKKVILSR